MTLRQSLVCVCLCVMAASAKAADKPVTITSSGKACTVDSDSVTISHDKSKKDRVYWKSGDGKAYVVSFKNSLSPCHIKKSKNETHRIMFSVPPNGQSDDCFAHSKTNVANYKYTVYNLDADNYWQQCADPKVVVSDGASTASSGPPKKK